MKIQCHCGAKYAFDVTPELAQRPIQFVCPACGFDASDFVNHLIREELRQSSLAPTEYPVAQAVAPAIEPAPVPAPRVALASAVSQTVPPTPAAPVRVQVHRASSKTPETAPRQSDQPLCPKHPGQRTVETCYVCGRPICPKCMALFGYLCSAACRGKAELQGIDVPVFAGQKALVERRRWRRVGLATAGVVALVAAFLGAWIWYAWFGSVPSTAFSVRFTEPAYAGASRLCGDSQIVFLHGGTLARHDMKAKKEVWSCQLIDKKQIARQVELEIKARQEAKAKSNSDDPDRDFPIPSADKLTKWTERAAMAALQLRVHGQNIWVVSPGKLARYDWNTGKPAEEIPLLNQFGGLISRGDELLTIGTQPDKQVITHINLANGQTRDEEIALPEAPAASGIVAKRSGRVGRSSSSKTLAGLSRGTPGQDAGTPLDPAKVSEQVARLSLAETLALPATLGINRNQERALAELNDTPRTPAKTRVAPRPAERFSLIPAKTGCVQLAAQLLEERMVTRTAMKAPPKKSALDGPVNMAATLDVANEILNEMQRDRGGDTVTEDESLYRVTIRCPTDKDVPDWVSEVTGPPALFPLETVNVLTAGRTLIVLDKKNKKLWDGALSYPVRGGGALDDANAEHGLGPCVERGDRLYVFDQGLLSAFDLKSGNAHWRLPSVGISGLFFDDEGMLYVNTTTASHESLKYSRQIDVSQRTSDCVVKVNPQTGKILWTTQTAGTISYLSGEFIYTLQSHQAMDEEDESPYTVRTGFETQPYLRIRRINPKNGKEMWEHFQQRAPLDVQFDKNSIQLVFKKELQVLKYLVL